MKKRLKKFLKILTGAGILLVGCAFPCTGADPDDNEDDFADREEKLLSEYTEEDIGRLLMARQDIIAQPKDGGTRTTILKKWDFAVFHGFDEEMRLLCDPLTGARQRYAIPAESLMKLPYFKDGECYEMILDACLYFSSGSFTRNTSKEATRFSRIQRLLKIFNRGTQIRSMVRISEIQRKNTLILRKKKEQVLKLLEIRRKAKPENFDATQLEQTEQEVFDTVQNMTNDILAELNTVIQTGDLPQAVACYLHVKKYYSGWVFPYLDKTVPKSMFGDNLKTLKDAVSSSLADVEKAALQLMQRQYSQQVCTSEYLALFPNAIGPWNEAVPQNGKELSNLFYRIFRIRGEEGRYSSVTEFEKWGNCRLTLLLLVQDRKEAEYLKNQFVTGCTNYKMKMNIK